MKQPTRRQVIDELWLLYFNDYLLQRGVIDETEHRKMAVKIKTRSASAKPAAK